MTPPLLLAGWEWGAVITWIARYAVVLAAPVLIILFLFELAIVLGSISGKRLHITELGVTGKNALFLVVIPVYLVFASVFLAEALRVFASSILSKFDLRP
jgi:type III secretory pathway component EscT